MIDILEGVLLDIAICAVVIGGLGAFIGLLSGTEMPPWA